jgi:transposase
MARGPKPVPLTLSDEERRALEAIVRRRSSGQALAQRARIVLACAEPGSTTTGVARSLGVSRPSVTRPSVTTWRARFVADRLDGLVDLPRSGAPRQVGDDAIERLITLTLETQPDNATHWSTRAMAQRVGMSQTLVSRVWRAFGLQPHRAETFKLSSDPAFVDKVRDVVGLYLSPPERALVLCVDEKPQIEAPDRSPRSKRSRAPRLFSRCAPASPSA